ncbi:FBXL16 [Lepeophtheirus salmonis]|uniref:FBXL16 n=1 Tax=Lepeophtheirus salmonis TaxID=72036 RepID=A0A7R8HB99_LEPSM|nr:FBXL16 [Lepeophtheirus salmonis]CAF2970373.1 FBXL16 [Lepeophtheirus salmonis]
MFHDKVFHGGSSTEDSTAAIAKGSVMDKVNHVFSSNYEMGNANNKEKDSSGINIPKGAVANGRAKFEAGNNQSQVGIKPSPEKPMRFFGSRNRTHSPILPVKSPKVPTSSSFKTNESVGQTMNKEEESGIGENSSSSPKPNEENNKLSSDKFSVIKTAPTATPPPLAQLSSSSTTSNSTASSSIPNIPSTTSSRITNSKYYSNMKRFMMWEELWQDYKFLLGFLRFFRFSDRLKLAQVCRRWREVMYQPSFWRDIQPVLHYRTIRHWKDPEENENKEEELPDEVDGLKKRYFGSLKSRGFDSFVLLNANDADVFDFIQNFPHGAKFIHCLTLRCCNLSDRGLEALIEFLQGLYRLEVVGCNEITEQGLWSSLHPRLVSLTINDCINVADECICAVTQLLPSLYEFNLQAYHVTDSALSYFSPKQTNTLSILRLQSCWEITNHGVVNIVHTLPNITVLSLSGCSKLTDDGIELIAENLRKLRSLDVSWCPRVTDAALEYIACDLNHLEELTLDRCVHITDIGIGYISTMLALHTLFLRWCTQIRDFGLQHICGMRSIQILSLAGCPLLSSSGLSNLIQLRHLQELELNNCPGATTELVEYLRQNIPKCLVLV